MVLNVPEIPPKVTRIVTLSGGQRGVPGKATLSLFKDVAIRLGQAGVKGKSDNVTLYEGVFFDCVPWTIIKVFPRFLRISISTLGNYKDSFVDN